MFASTLSIGLWLLAASWTVLVIGSLLWSIAKSAQQDQQRDQMTQMLTGELQAAKAAGDELGTKRVERALGERSSRRNHPTAWGRR